MRMRITHAETLQSFDTGDCRENIRENRIKKKPRQRLGQTMTGA